MRTFKLLVNPTSGNGLGQKILQSSLSIPVAATEPHNIQQQLQEFLEPGDTLIIAGGDGTLHLVLNGLYQTELYKKICVALYPLGTGNDFAKAFSIQTLPIHGFLQKLSLSTTVTMMPLWQFNHHVFINYISWGIGAKIIADVNRWRKALPKNKIITKFLYVISGLINFIFLPKFRLTTTNETLLSLIFCNINFYGGGCYLGDKKNNSLNELTCFKLKNRFDFFKMVLSRLTRIPMPGNNTISTFNSPLHDTYLQIDGEPLPCRAGTIQYVGNIEVLS